MKYHDLPLPRCYDHVTIDSNSKIYHELRPRCIWTPKIYIIEILNAIEIAHMHLIANVLELCIQTRICMPKSPMQSHYLILTNITEGLLLTLVSAHTHIQFIMHASIPADSSSIFQDHFRKV